jgi:hypothetical protein
VGEGGGGSTYELTIDTKKRKNFNNKNLFIFVSLKKYHFYFNYYYHFLKSFIHPTLLQLEKSANTVFCTFVIVILWFFLWTINGYVELEGGDKYIVF